VVTAGGFYLPNANREGYFYKDVKKALVNIGNMIYESLKKDQLMLMTTRPHDQFNTTIYGLNNRYRGIYYERRVIFMNQADMNARGLKEKELVDIF